MSEQNNNNQNKQQYNNNNNKNNAHKDSQQKPTWMKIAGIVIMVAVVVGLALFDRNKNAKDEVLDVQPPLGCEPGNVFSTVTGEPCPGADLEAAAANAVAPKSEGLSYDSALATYKDATITLANGCVATPTEATFPAGTRVMVANSGTEAMNIILGKRSALVSPLHYATSVLKEAGTYDLTCDDTVVAKVTIQ